MAKKKMCKLCGEKEAEIPDRFRTSAVFRPEICRSCHALKLQSDLKSIHTNYMNRTRRTDCENLLERD
jgi:hypothetical protein